MTLRERYDALLKDLKEERVYFGERWAHYYDKHIAELEAAMEERYGTRGGSGDLSGRESGGDSAGGGTGVV